MQKEVVEECVQKYFDSLKGVKSLSKEEEHDLLKRYKENNDIGARNKLIVANLKYACKLATGFRGRGLAYYDLISEANNGLIDAIDKFDMSNDVKLISYAKWWIIQRMQYAIEIRNKMPYSELPSDKDKQFFDDDSINMQEKNNDYNKLYYETDDNVSTESENKFLNDVFECLTKRETDMINMYYGRNYDKSFTLDEIGFKYSLTKERVRQIIENAFKKIRSEAILVDSKYLSR